MVMMDFDGLLEQGDCGKCGSATKESFRVQQVPAGSGDEFFEVEVPVVECPTCGFSYTDHRAEVLRHEGACRYFGLLTPDEVKAVRANLRMSRRQFDEAFGIPPASQERWENGRLMQNKSLDTLLRALQNPATAARLDRRLPTGDSRRGKVLAGRFPVLERQPKALDEAKQRSITFSLRATA